MSKPVLIAIVLVLPVILIIVISVSYSHRSTENEQPTPKVTFSPTETKLQNPSISQAQQNTSSSSLSPYTSPDFGISFEYPKTGKISEGKFESEGVHEIELYFDTSSWIFINYEENPSKVNPKEWFLNHREKYNELIVEIGETEIGGNPALFVGIPKTCRSSPLIVAFIKNKSRIFTFSQYESDNRTRADELGQILQFIVFQNHDADIQPIPQGYLEYPKPPANIVCP